MDAGLDSYAAGFADKCAAYGVDPERLVKHAGLAEGPGSDMMKGIFGNKLGPWVEMAADFTPAGVVPSGLNAGGDFGNALTPDRWRNEPVPWKERGGSALSGLGNTLLTAGTFLPAGGALGKWGVKTIPKITKFIRGGGVGAIGKGLKGTETLVAKYAPQALPFVSKMRQGYAKNVAVPARALSRGSTEWQKGVSRWANDPSKMVNRPVLDSAGNPRLNVTGGAMYTREVPYGRKAVDYLARSPKGGLITAGMGIGMLGDSRVESSYEDRNQKVMEKWDSPERTRPGSTVPTPAVRGGYYQYTPGHKLM